MGLWKVIWAAAAISSLLSGRSSHAQESGETSGKKRMHQKRFDVPPNPCHGKTYSFTKNALSNVMPWCGNCINRISVFFRIANSGFVS